MSGYIMRRILPAGFCALLAVTAARANETITSLVAVDRGASGATLFATNGTNSILRADIDSNATIIPADSFRVFYRSAQLAPISAVAILRTDLVLWTAHRLLRVDPNTGDAAVIYQNENLDVAALTPLDDSRLLVADTANRRVAIIELGADQPIRYVDVPFMPVALATYGGDVLIVDNSQANIGRFHLVDNGSAMHLEAVFDDVVRRFAPTTTLTLFNGIVYASGHNQLSTFGALRGAAAARLPADTSLHAVGPLAATARALFVLKDDGQIYITERPVPTDIGFRNITTSNVIPLVGVYTQLDDAKQMPMRTAVVTRAPTIEAMLYREHVTIPARVLHVDGELSHDIATATALVRLLCRWNPGKCSATTGPELLSRPVSDGEEFRLPDLALTPNAALGEISLRGLSLGAALRARLSSPQERARWTAAQIARINPGLSRTVEATVARAGMIVATPPSDTLTPGSVVVDVSQGHETVARPCAVVTSSVVRSEAFPDLLESNAFEEILPWSNLTPNLRGLAHFRIAQVKVHYEGVQRERLTTFNVATQPSDAANGCAQGPYVVREALKAQRIAILASDSDGRTIYLSGDDLRQLGLNGDPDPHAEWSLIVNRPLYIAYEAVSSTDGGDLLTKPHEDASTVKPSARQNVLNVDKGSFILPFDSWSLWVALPRSWLRADGPFHGYLRTFERVPMLPEEAVESVGLMVSNGGTEKPAEATTETSEAYIDTDSDAEQAARRSRTDLLTAIKADNIAPERALVESTLAIAEKAPDIDYKHPAFFTPTGSVFEDYDDQGGAVIPQYESRESTGPRVSKRRITEEEHGTHVAGILVAQPSSVTPGLVPNAHLTVVNSSSSGAFYRGVRSTQYGRVQVFGISFGWTKAKALEPALGDIHTELLNSCPKCLFVIAAGDDGLDFSAADAKPYPMIGWLPEIAKQAIGVGASDGDQLLADTSDGQPPHYETNYGNSYVQLLAPGRNIYSTAGKATYAYASGTSQAVPQVAAAAAMLLAQVPEAELSVIKARLIYTADAIPTLENKRMIWGGLLNVQHAIAHLHKNVIRLIDGTLVSVEFPGRGPRITVINPIYVDPGPPIQAPADVPVDLFDVLRFTADDSRVIYVDPPTAMRRMHIASRVEALRGNLPCDWLRVWDADKQKFVYNLTTSALISRCKTGGLTWGDVADYTAAISSVPNDIIFPEGELKK